MSGIATHPDASEGRELQYQAQLIDSSGAVFSKKKNADPYFLVQDNTFIESLQAHEHITPPWELLSHKLAPTAVYGTLLYLFMPTVLHRGM